MEEKLPDESVSREFSFSNLALMFVYFSCGIIRTRANKEAHYYVNHWIWNCDLCYCFCYCCYFGKDGDGRLGMEGVIILLCALGVGASVLVVLVALNRVYGND